MSRVIRVSEGTSEKTDGWCNRIKCSIRCRELSGSRRGLMYDVVELSVAVDEFSGSRRETERTDV